MAMFRTGEPTVVSGAVFTPGGGAPAGGWPVLVAIHGGGWLGGDPRAYGRQLAPLARRGVAVASVGYRLSKDGRPSWPGTTVRSTGSS